MTIILNNKDKQKIKAQSKREMEETKDNLTEKDTIYKNKKSISI